MSITRKHLGHDNIKAAVIAVPAKFDTFQREATVHAFRSAGIKVARILEEPVAAALAYGLQKKENVDYIIVYDFGGGTLDVSVLQVSKDGYVEVMGSDGDDNLGGADFDAAVAHFLLDGDDGKRIVLDRLQAAYSSLRTSSNGKFATDSEIEERLFADCSILGEKPLCTLSFFHTIAEQIKIELSSFDEVDGHISKTCIGLSREEVSLAPSFDSIDDFCSALKPVEL